MRQPKLTGAILPSSPHLAERMIQQIDFDKAASIVEFGPGTGSFTRLILSRKRECTSFFALELNENMYLDLHRQYPELLLYNDSATRIHDYLQKNRLTRVDAVISGLPWANFSEQTQDEILIPTISALHPGGTFSCFAYLQGLVLPSAIRFRRKLNRYFRDVKVSPVVWRNCPPAIVYWCTR